MYKDFSYTSREYTFVEKTESTNNDMKKSVYGSSFPVFSVLSADSQQGGRGRLGRQFFSPRGGLYFSFTLPLTGREENIPFITLLSGLAVSEALKELTGVGTQIKWPNDIYLNGKKLGGILCELVTAKNKLTAVVGIGINLSITAEEIPAELSDKMTSLCIEGITLPDKKRLAEAVVQKTDSYVYSDLQLYEVSDEILTKLRSLSFSIGKKVKYMLENEVCEGIVTDITKTGAAEILFSDGSKKEIFCGEIIQ